MTKRDTNMRVMIRYTVRADAVDRSLDLLRAVYDELAQTRPHGLHYDTYQLDDQASFVAIIDSDGHPASAPHHRLASFQRYRAALSAICVDGPTVHVLSEAGSYHCDRTAPTASSDTERTS
ncbi:hypothetical protein [Streptosporangium saharense]|uniref:Quinol monooxygenase YgiN n=1 Tax=Streptosporangium saharense TaxID=1706840 RepID=A0A7W7VR54_9ACTN|nr:hypothetical protein [Streptosporangium saharense]MBB4919722.1 quinol monooxygenase YgiN [Streptosporangium saharense]